MDVALCIAVVAMVSIFTVKTSALGAAWLSVQNGLAVFMTLFFAGIHLS